MKQTIRAQKRGPLSLSFLLAFFVMVSGPMSMASQRSDSNNQITKTRSLGTITFILGDVSVQRHHITEWQEVLLNEAVYSGDRLMTGKESRLEISFSNGSIIRIDENTSYQLSCDDKATRSEGQSVIFLDMTLGRIWANIRTILSGKQEFQVRSPIAVMAIRGTIARFDAVDDASEIYVYRGKVDVAAQKQTMNTVSLPHNMMPPIEVEGPSTVEGPKEISMSEWVQLVAGQMIQIRKNGEMERRTFDHQKMDSDWISWNMQRDKTPLHGQQ